jgi:Cd2+/Zn2+-exporting ATPase
MSECTCSNCKKKNEVEEEEENEEDEKKELIVNLVYLFGGISLLIAGFVLQKLEPIYTEFSWSLFQDQGFYSSKRFISFLIYTIGYAFLLTNLIKEAIEGFKEKEFVNEVTLMIIATAGAYAIGEFPEALFVILFSIIGEILEDQAVARSSASIKKLVNNMPLYAHIVENDGSIHEGKPEELKVGDIIEIKPGEKIPVDGLIIKGKSSLDLSSINGESLPKDGKEGDLVFSGSINLDSVIQIKATKAYSDSTLTKIMDLVESEETKKAKSEKFITRFSAIYTPLVLGIAIVVFLVGFGISGWSFANGGREWLYRACSILLISCPCALVISVPVAFFSGIGSASKLGVLMKGSLSLENLAKAEDFVFDKTGTLTKGNFVLINKPEENALKIAASLESKSTHPLAKAIKNAYQGTLLEVEDFKNIPGKGIEGTIENETYLIGGKEFLEENNILVTKEDTPFKVLYLASLTKKEFLSSFIVADEIKDTSKDTIISLKKEGVKKNIMLSGDDAEIAKKVGSEIALDEVKGGLLPAEKLEKIKELTNNDIVAYVGDGINDSPALLASHVGISMGALGSDAAIEASDVVIMDDNLIKVAEGRRLAKRTMRIVRWCVIASLLVKAIIMVLVVSGLLGAYSMIVASLADTGVLAIALLIASIAMHYKPKYLKQK